MSSSTTSSIGEGTVGYGITFLEDEDCGKFESSLYTNTLPEYTVDELLPPMLLGLLAGVRMATDPSGLLALIVLGLGTTSGAGGMGRGRGLTWGEGMRGGDTTSDLISLSSSLPKRC